MNNMFPTDLINPFQSHNLPLPPLSLLHSVLPPSLFPLPPLLTLPSSLSAKTSNIS